MSQPTLKPSRYRKSRSLLAWLAIGFLNYSLPSFGGDGVHGEKPPYATVEVSQGSGNQAKNLAFKVVPLQNLMINEEAPWSLAVEGAGISFAQAKLKRADYDPKVPGFSLSVLQSPKVGTEFSYTLTAFVCTKDKGRCFREVVKGKATVNPFP